jgi:hypothetical protein
MMEHLLLFALATCGLWAVLTQTDGPWEILLKMRLALFRNAWIGAFAYKLFSCPICMGAWCAAGIYLVQGIPFVLYVFAGCACVFLFSHLWD